MLLTNSKIVSPKRGQWEVHSAILSMKEVLRTFRVKVKKNV